MSDVEDLQKQLADLQSNYTHQQEAIESLNDTIIKQWEAIDKLARIVGQCADQIVSIHDSIEGEATDPPPPHY